MILATVCTSYANESDSNKFNNVHISLTAKQLSIPLNIKKEQVDMVDYTMEQLDVMTTSIENEASEQVRSKMFYNAINNNLRLMSGILTKDQYKVYLRLLNITLINRGLSK